MESDTHFPPQPTGRRTTWPAPDPEQRRRSETLCGSIRAEIESSDGIEFSRYMELALYAPGLGYYSSGQPLFGESGDFITAPEIGGMFAGCIARQCAQVLAAIGAGGVLEFGAGSGRLAADVLLELERLQCIPDVYQIVELGPELRARQHATVLATAPHLLDRVHWLEGLPEPGFRGVVIANEVIDAMPVTRFRRRRDGIARLWVHWDGARFVEIERLIDGLGIEGLDASTLPDGYTSEVCPRAAAWIRALAEVCAQAAVLVVDYGFPAREYYHPDRRQGTLMCHYRHRAHADPYINVGLQDITAHVDFSALGAAAASSGLRVAGYTQLAPFLLALGVADRVQDPNDADARGRIAAVQELKKLTMPYEMGELFKVIALIKGFDAELTGFSLLDHRGRL